MHANQGGPNDLGLTDVDRDFTIERNVKAGFIATGAACRRHLAAPIGQRLAESLPDQQVLRETRR